jgi:hypothetical protein
MPRRSSGLTARDRRARGAEATEIEAEVLGLTQRQERSVRDSRRAQELAEDADIKQTELTELRETLNRQREVARSVSELAHAGAK